RHALPVHVRLLPRRGYADRDLLLAVAVQEGADVDGVPGTGLDPARQEHTGRRAGLLVALLEIRAHVEEIERRVGRRGGDVDVALAVAVAGAEPGEQVPASEAGAVVGDEPHRLGSGTDRQGAKDQAGDHERARGRRPGPRDGGWRHAGEE